VKGVADLLIQLAAVSAVPETQLIGGVVFRLI